MVNTPRKKLTYVSVFSGIEAASVAWEPLGFEPVAFAEVDPFPSAVLKERYPNVPNLGDITKIDWSDYHGKIDIVVGGSPCQSFSVAGKREGLAGESGLMFEYIRAVREIMPRYFVWENVPGALSSEKGEAFRQLLSEMDDLGYGLAWRVLDAQFVRVPERDGEGFVGPVAQRRRRIFLVGCLGDPEGAAEILFESDSLRWDHPSSREKRKELARAAQQRTSEGSEGCLTPWDSQTIRIYSEGGPFATLMNNSGNGKTGLNRQSVLTKAHEDSDCLTPWDNQSKRVFTPESCGPTLSYGAGMNTTPSVLTTAGFKYHQGSKAGNIGYEAEQAPTLTADGNHPPAICYSIAGNIINRKDQNGGNQFGVVDADDNGAFTLNTIDRHAVAFQQNTRDEVRLINGDGEIAGALSASSGAKQTNYVCERALPFNTTQITSPHNGNKPQWGDPCHTLAAQDHPPAICLSNGDDVVGALCASDAKWIGNQYVNDGKVICMADATVNAAIDSNVCVAVTAHAQNEPPVVCMASGQANAEIEVDMTPAQAARQHKDPQIVCTTQYGEEVAGTLMAKADSSPCHDKGANVMTDGYIVRRLTPLECERLQGFPDNWTKIPYKGKSADDCPDTPRYKALGNSFAVPVVRWIGNRIQDHVEKGTIGDKSY